MDTDTQAHRMPWKMKAEIRVILLQAKEPERWPANPREPGEGPGTDPCLSALRRNQPSAHLDVRHPGPELDENKYLGFASCSL